MAAEDSEILAPSLSLRDFFQILRRRKTTAFIVFISVFGLILLTTLFAKSQYISSTRLMLEDQSKSAPAPQGLSDIFAPQSGLAVDSQVELINSPLILDQVYKESNIAPGTVDVGVKRVDLTNVIEVTAISSSQDDVVKFASDVPRVYQLNRRGENVREVNSELRFAKKDLEQESQKLADVEAAIVAFKDRNNLIDPSGEAAAALQQAAASRSALQQARADISSLRAQIVALEADLSSLPPNVNSPVVSTNPQIQTLRNQLADLQSERDKLSFLYTPADDNIRKIDLQIRDLNTRIQNTPKTVTTNTLQSNPNVADTRNRVAGLRADLSAKEASTAVLARQSSSQNSSLKRYSNIDREQAQLNRQLDASQTAVRAGGENVRQLTVRAKAIGDAGAPITVIRPATGAVKIAPKPSRNVVLGLFLGALFACAAALLQDSMDDRLRDEEDVRQLLGTSVLAQFPLLPVSDEKQIIDTKNPNRILLETFRSLRSNVQFALVNSTGKKLQITSTVPNEGKSYIASNLAITMALDGRRVILVDADLHRPTMHERFSGLRVPGLTNILVGQITLEDALQDVGIKSLRLLSAGALPPNPAELLNSAAMQQVMEQLEEMADLIIFDTPPLLATSDSQLMAAKMDGVVFVMQMGSAPRSATQRAFELLTQAHANLIGIVFNKVSDGNLNSYGKYGGYYTRPSDVPDDEILSDEMADSVVRALPMNMNSTKNGTDKNGNGINGNGNGNHANGSPMQTTVFDESISGQDNSN